MRGDLFNDVEFKAHFRMARDLIPLLVDLLKDCCVFWHQRGFRQKGTVELHILVFLKFLGSNGSNALPLKLAGFFKMGTGTLINYVDRTTAAFLSLREKVIFWPSKEERQEISTRIQNKHKFPNVVGIIDGTLLPLETKPTCNGEDYFSRKGGYTINCLITCDDTAKVRNLVVGWPGSVHDTRVWDNSLALQCFVSINKHFN
jgi:hypothetical protein